MTGCRRLCLYFPRLAAEAERGGRKTLRRLAGWAVRFSPLVEVVEPDTLLIDITGCERLFGGEANIARQAVEGLRRQGFDARAAIADTVGAAYALAHAGVSRGEENVGCAIFFIPAGKTAEGLSLLPPAALRIDEKAAVRLEALGVRTIGDLLKLPRASLPARFGGQLVLRLQQALGEVSEGVATYQPDEVPQTGQSFEETLHEWPALQPVVARLLTELFVQLRRADLALRQLDCVLRFERAAPRTLSIGLSRPSRSVKHTGELLEQRLERVDLSAGVCGVRLLARETARWRAGQVELFEPREPEDDERLGCLLDRLAGRLGEGAVVRVQLLEDYQPERAFRYVRAAEGCEKGFSHQHPGCEKGFSHQHPGFSHQRSHQHREPPIAAGVGTANLRPVRLLARPVLIRVMAVVPDGPPTWFAYQGREYVVVGAAGPERIETAWWRGPDVRRDYFRVTVESGEQFWVFHAFNDGQWYLNGIFA
jgi:protein ImuB